MSSKKVITSIIVAIVLVFASIVTAGCVHISEPSQDSLDTPPSSLVIIDADPGIDDSIAFFLESKVIGDPDFYIATVGNVELDILKRNFVAILEYLNYDGEYALGAESRLDGAEAYYDGFYGEDGLGELSKEFIKIAKEKYNYNTSEIISPELEEEIMKMYFTYESISDIASGIKDYDSITYITLGHCLP